MLKVIAYKVTELSVILFKIKMNRACVPPFLNFPWFFYTFSHTYVYIFYQNIYTYVCIYILDLIKGDIYITL